MLEKNKKSRARKIPLGTLNIGPYAKKLILQTLNENRLSHGPLSARFENKFAKLHNRKFAIFTVSGTAALRMSLHALKRIYQWRDGEEVLVPAITFIATSNIVLQNNLRPIFVDVLPDTYNIDPKKIEEKITRKTRAIIPVHLYGLPADMEPIMAIAKKHKLKVIEDSCEAMLAKYRGRMVGSMGDLGCFSTYVAHIITTGVGGIVTTNNPEYAVRVKSLMNHGRDSIYLTIDDDNNLSRKSDKEIFKTVDRRFSFIDIGYSCRLTEMEAALGLEQLKYIKTNIRKRQKNAAYLAEGLKQFSYLIQLPIIPRDRDHVFLAFPIVMKDKLLERSKLLTHLEKHGIETRYMMPLLNQPIYKEIFGNLEPRYPVARYINKAGFYIACHHNLTKDDLDYILAIFEQAFQKLV
ncbi:DegT/DnrJ/EryC1/StrS family aminotransferase [Patescibacteria group bacterium AH-259-L07]|nr:DegT/DnrJ/EryC1/StrS family aminotransferase [Patescibacteria group bacterium AH-259-L07]